MARRASGDNISAAIDSNEEKREEINDKYLAKIIRQVSAAAASQFYQA